MNPVSNTEDFQSKVVADDLSKDQVSQLVQFMLGLSNGRFSQKGNTIQVSNLPRRKLKFLLHKFLHVQRLSDYGVLDTSGVFEIIQIKPQERKPEKHENLKSSMPFDPFTANAHGRPLYAPWMKPSDLIQWQGKPPKDKKDKP